MSQIDKKKLSKEIEEKYSVHDNAFDLDVIKNPELDRTGEVKDDVRAIIGDDKEPDKFIPQLKLARWSGESSFSIRLKDTEGEEQLTTEKDHIKWSKGNTEIEFYDYEEGEGGYKLVWFLKEKPLTNKVEFTIQSKGLDFFYQPELTQKEKDEGAERPENVVGSYAVYHSTKGGMNDKDGKEYKTGKAFHIYRPKIIDANGAETWGILHIENGIYSVEIPQEFLDKAIYPIKSNDTFGYTSSGASEEGTATTVEIMGSHFSAPASGTITKTSHRVRESNLSAIPYVKSIIATYTDGELQTTDTQCSTFSGTAYQWLDLTIDSSGGITSGVSYWLLSLNFSAGGYFIYMAYDSGDAGDGALEVDGTKSTGTVCDSDYSGYFPVDTDAGWTSQERKYSIYATYTPAATDLSVNVSDQLNITESVSIARDPAVSVSDQLNLTEDTDVSVTAPPVDLSVKVEPEEIIGVIIY